MINLCRILGQLRMDFVMILVTAAFLRRIRILEMGFIIRAITPAMSTPVSLSILMIRLIVYLLAGILIPVVRLASPERCAAPKLVAGYLVLVVLVLGGYPVLSLIGYPVLGLVSIRMEIVM